MVDRNSNDGIIWPDAQAPADDGIIWPDAAPQQGLVGEIGSQFVRGVQELGEVPSQLRAMGESIFGSQEEAQRLRAASQQRLQGIAQARPAQVESLEQAVSVGTPGSYGRWAATATARAAPSMLPGIAGALIGMVVGGPIGAGIGFGLGSVAPNTAESFMGASDAQGQPAPGVAAAAGGVKSLLDALPAGRLLSRALGRLPQHEVERAAARGILRNMGQEIPASLAYEGITEAGQEVVDQIAQRWAADNWTELTNNDYLQIAESGIVGGLLGGMGGAATGSVARRNARATLAQQEQGRQEATRAEEQRRAAVQEQHGGLVTDDAVMRNMLVQAGATQADVAALPYEELVRRSNALAAEDIVRQSGADPASMDPARQLAVARHLVLGQQGEEGSTAGGIAGEVARGPSFPQPMDPAYFDRIRQVARGAPKEARRAITTAINGYERALSEDNEPAAFNHFERLMRRLEILNAKQPELLAKAGVVPSAIKSRVGLGYNTNQRTLYVGEPKTTENREGSQFVPVPGHPEGGYAIKGNPQLQAGETFFRDEQAKDEAAQRISDEVERRISHLAKNYPEYDFLNKAQRVPGERGDVARPRPMEGHEEALADEFGMKSFYEGDAGDLQKTREVLNTLAEKFGIPKEAIGFGGEMNLFTKLPEDNALGDHFRARRGVGSPLDTLSLRVKGGMDFTSTLVHEWMHALDSALGKAFKSTRLLSGSDLRNVEQSNPALAKAFKDFMFSSTSGAPHFLGGATKLGSPYWSHPKELVARAAEAAFADLAKGTAFSRAFFQKSSRIPGMYPQGVERANITNKFSKLLKELRFTPMPGQRPGKFAYQLLAPGGAHLQEERTLEPTVTLDAEASLGTPGIEEAVTPEPANATPAEQAQSVDKQNAAKAPEAQKAQLEARAKSIGRFKDEREGAREEKLMKVPAAEAEKESMSATEDFKRMNAWNRWVNTPVYNAVKHALLRPFQNALFGMERIRSQKMHFYLDKIKPLQALSKAELRDVTRFAEVMNSMRQTPERAKDGSYTVTVPDYAKGLKKGMLNSAIKFSKPGDKITLTGKQAEAYAGLRSALDTFYDDMRNSILAKFGLKTADGKEIAKRIANLKAQAENEATHPVDKMRATREARHLSLLEDILQEFDKAKIEGYIPQMRAGRVRLVAVKAKNDGKGNYFRNADGDFVPVESDDPRDRTQVLSFDGLTLKQATRRADAYKAKLSKELGPGWVFQVKPTDTNAFMTQIAPSEKSLNMVEAMANLFMKGDKGLKLETELGRGGAQQTTSAFDLFLDQVHLLKEQAKKRGIKANFSHRNDYAGWLRPENFETYLPNAVGAYLVRGVDQLGLNYTERDRQDARNMLIKAGRADLYEYATEQEQDIYKPSYFVSQAKNVAFNWYLGWNLSSAAVNLTQLAQSSMPYLSSAGGTGRATMQMVRAMKDIMPILRPSIDEDKAINWSKRPASLTQDEWAFLRRAWEEGWASAIMTKEQSGALVAPLDNGALTGALVRTLGPTWKKAVQSMPMFFSAVEQYNRMVTALAAFRLASTPEGLKGFQRLADNNSLYSGQRLDPYLAGRMATEETQFMISKTNRPQMFRGGLGLLTQFGQFPLSMMELYWRQMKAAKVDKRAALAFFPMAFLGIAATAGAWGFPGVGDLSDLWRSFTKGFGPAFGITEQDLQRSVENFLRRSLREAGLDQETSRGVAEAFLRGPSRAFPGIDLSGRAGVKFNVADMLFSADPTNAIGPFGSMIISSLRDAVGYAQNGHPYLATTALMPTFARNLTKAETAMPLFSRMMGGSATPLGPISAATGGQRTPAGSLNSGGDWAALATGFTPAAVAREQELRHEAENRPMRALQENYRQSLVDALIRQRVASRNGNAQEAQQFAEEARNIRQAIAEHDRGQRADNRIRTPSFFSQVNRAVREGLEGPAGTAIRRLPQGEEALFRARLRDYRNE